MSPTTDRSPKGKLLQQVADLAARRLVARPRLTLVVALLVGGVSTLVASTITFDTRFSALLPESAEEVKQVKLVERKVGGTVQLVIAIGGRREARLPFARELVKRLRRNDVIRWADVEFPVEFFFKRRAWLLKRSALIKLRDAIDREIGRAKARANPFYVDLEDDDDKSEKAKPWAEVDSAGRATDVKALRKSTFTSPDGKYLFVRVKPKTTGFNMAAGRAALDFVKRMVAGLSPGSRGLTVRYAGNLPVNQEQNQRMQQDIRRAAIYALVLVLLLTTIYVRRLTALIVLAIPLLVGVALTLAVTALTIGQLNLVSGFLVSALVGLGVAFGVHLYLRYLEYRPKTESAQEAMRLAIVNTFPGCFTAATTTTAAFYAMMISDFRGFREYGLIAGTGVLITLVMTFITMPPVAMLLVRKIRPVTARAEIGLAAGRKVAWAVILIGVAFFAFSLWAKRSVGWLNDFRALRGHSELVEFYEYVQDALGGSLSPAAVMVDTVDQAARVEAIVAPYTKGARSPLTRMISLASMVPTDVAAKKKTLDEIEAILRKVDPKKLGVADRKKVEEALALVTIGPWTAKQIPDVFRRQFLSLDQKNTFVVIWPRSDLYLGSELKEWAELLQTIQDKVRAAGMPTAVVLDENRIAARVVSEVREELPRVFAYAGIAVLLLLALDFRDPKKVFWLSLSLGVGATWVIGGMYLFDIQLNMFNQSVLPMILGIGIDNAVHMQRRYELEGSGSIPHVLRTTGAAALLASTTTAIGFGATISANHLGINSLGWLSIIGIGGTFLGSTIFFPAILQVLEKKPRDSRVSPP